MTDDTGSNNQFVYSVKQKITMNETKETTTTNNGSCITQPNGITTITATTNNKNKINDNNIADEDVNLNWNAIDGVRCLTCLGIVSFHTIYITGVPLFLRSSSCFTAIYRQIPIVSLFYFRVTWHLTLFWILSGFLCEYQLYTLMYNNNNNNNNKLYIQQSKNIIEQQQQELIIKQQNNTIINGNGNNVLHHQQQEQQQPEISLYDYISFLLNRLIRLYPLYVIIPTGILIENIITPSFQDIYTLRDYIYTLLFIKTWDANFFCNVWTVQIDIHGYIIIVLLFAVTYQYTYGGTARTTTNNVITNKKVSKLRRRQQQTLPKRLFLIVWYILSLINVLWFKKPFTYQNVSKESAESIQKYGSLGIDTMSDKQQRWFGIPNYGGGGQQAMYPEYFLNNDNNNTIIEIRNYYTLTLNDTYFTGIFGGHGSAMMLGSLLFINLYQRQFRPYYPLTKLVFSMIFLFGTDGWHVVSGIASYYFLEAILTIQPRIVSNEQMKSFGTRFYNIFVTGILGFLSNKYFRFVAPYTYGIYLFHTIPLFKRMKLVLPTKIKTIITGASMGTEACQALADIGQPYNIVFIIKEAIIAFVVALILSITLHHIIEQPFLWLRKVYIPSLLFSNSNSRIIIDKNQKTK